MKKRLIWFFIFILLFGAVGFLLIYPQTYQAIKTWVQSVPFLKDVFDTLRKLMDVQSYKLFYFSVLGVFVITLIGFTMGNIPAFDKKKIPHIKVSQSAYFEKPTVVIIEEEKVGK